jgi:heme/copper-type cytochrome/quinol oxidase subunit 4
MNHTTPAQALCVWFLLVVATLGGTWLAEHHGLAGRWTVAVILLLAAFKVRLVMIHFMELGKAPWRWRATFQTWIVVVCSLIGGMYFVALSGQG